MFIHRPIALAMCQSLSRIFDENWLADREIERAFKENKKWGAKDRAQFAKVVYDITRFYRKFAVIAQVTDSLQASPDRFQKVLQCYFTLNNYETNLTFEYPISKHKLINSLDAITDPAIKSSLPDWLYQFGQSELGKEKWEEQISWLNTEAPLFVRANTLKTSPSDLIKVFAADGIESELVPGFQSALRVRRTNLFKTQAFKDGLFEVQDIHSQKVSEILDPQPGERIVDACAGGGGKSLHIAALMKNKGQLIAMDTHTKRLEQLKLRARRAGVFNAEVRVIGSAKDMKRLRGTVDRLLLDVPCSGIGVYRRNPDARWRLSMDKLEHLNRTQFEILSEYSQLVKPGGTIVYSTCSIFPSENQKITNAFLSQKETQYQLESDVTHWCANDSGDGFYICKIKKLH